MDICFLCLSRDYFPPAPFLITALLFSLGNLSIWDYVVFLELTRNSPSSRGEFMTQAGSTRASYPPLVVTGSGTARDPSRAGETRIWAFSYHCGECNSF